MTAQDGDQEQGDLPSVQESLDALAAHFEQTAFAPEVSRQYAQGHLEATLEAAGSDVPKEYVAAVLVSDHKTRDAYRRSLGSSHLVGPVITEAWRDGMPHDWAEQMADRGPKWSQDCAQRWSQGLTADELDRLDAAGLAKNPTMAIAYAGKDHDEVNRWLEAARDDEEFATYLARYQGHQGIGTYIEEGVPLQDVKLCHELGAEPGLARHGLRCQDGAVQKGPGAIRELVQYAEQIGQSTDEARAAIALGLDAKEVKPYGANVMMDHIPVYQRSGVEPKVVKSLLARDRGLEPHDVAALSKAGVKTGKDLTAWRKTVDPRGVRLRAEVFSDITAVASSGVRPEVTADLKKGGVPLAAIPTVHAAGISDITPWAQALQPRAQTGVHVGGNPAQAAAQHIAAFANAGGTPDQLARAQRGGIPLTEVAVHTRSTPQQLWDAGATGRKRVLADEARMRHEYGSMAPPLQPWPAGGPDDL
ncbi:hypothetical protein [Pseudactinotalea sp. Z1748]|uniref:hypothetical protein n=1 Tax=Pseudactinotalea sp. Z1748 TaxID=3413027 RepID=UPI003C7EAEFC